MQLDNVGHTPPQKIEQKVSFPTPTVEKIIGDTNAQLSGVRLELPVIIEAKERRIWEISMERLKPRIEAGEYQKGITVRYINENLYSMKSNNTGNVNSYMNGKGEVLFGIGSIKKWSEIENGKVYSDLGLIEKKKGTLKEMYHIVGYKVGKDGSKEPILEGPIDQESQEGFEMWKDILFHSTILDTLYLIKDPGKLSKIWIKNIAEEGSLRFQELEMLKRRGALDEEVFQFGLGEVRKVLLAQCNPDNPIAKRLAKYGDALAVRTDETTGEMRETRKMSITEDDLRDYHKKGYITEEYMNQCLDLVLKKKNGGKQ